jgi:predicted secreted hydrolase
MNSFLKYYMRNYINAESNFHMGSMKRAGVLLSILILVVVPVLGGSATERFVTPSYSNFSPQDITLIDDAFHGHGPRPFTEWWYFDAMFDNNYSAQMSIRVVSTLGKGFVFKRLDLYKGGTLVSHAMQSFHLSELLASSEIPFIQMDGSTLINGTYDNSTGAFVFDVSFSFPTCSTNLHFVGCTKGWKGQTKGGVWWAVVLPRADVTGTIMVDNETINVTGTGYHDHNWDLNGKAVLNFGWFWGKVNSMEYTVTWSAIMPSRFTMQPVMVVNEKNAGYIAVPSATIWFSSQDTRFDHFKPIPFFFSIETMTDKVFLIVNMEVVSVQHERFMFFMNYWRYHVKCTGTFMVNGHAEPINGVFIAEYLRFH